MNELTVIIPFLNEGQEVFKTVENILNTSNYKVNMILINDASNDGVDYESELSKYNITYICHEHRQGVAASRDEAVNLCQTKYFILLDAHMRVFQNDWQCRIIEKLNADERLLLCCKTVPLNIFGEIEQHFIGYGAYLNDDLSIGWIISDMSPDKIVVEVPCVLGASYACSKDYWLYLKGLNGLRSFGFDEQLISIKVWLEGGKCKLIKDVCFGHIFRSIHEVPYKNDSFDFIYNHLYVIELLTDIPFKYVLFEKVREKIVDKKIFDAAIEILIEEKTNVTNHKEYFKKIFFNDFSYFWEYNKAVSEMTIT